MITGNHISNSITETFKLAADIQKSACVGNVIALIGNLGTGKTTFTQGFADSMGVKENVGSPTFKLVSEYQGREYWLYHIDCYRLKDINEFINIGGEEYLSNNKGVTLIEWADIIEGILPDDTIVIKFDRKKDTQNLRKISICKK